MSAIYSYIQSHHFSGRCVFVTYLLWDEDLRNVVDIWTALGWEFRIALEDEP